MRKIVKAINVFSMCVVGFGVYAMLTKIDTLVVVMMVLAVILCICTAINLKEAK